MSKPTWTGSPAILPASRESLQAIKDMSEEEKYTWSYFFLSEQRQLYRGVELIGKTRMPEDEIPPLMHELSFGYMALRTAFNMQTVNSEALSVWLPEVTDWPVYITAVQAELLNTPFDANQVALYQRFAENQPELYLHFESYALGKTSIAESEECIMGAAATMYDALEWQIHRTLSE